MTKRALLSVYDKTGLEAILAAADYFFEKTGRQVTYEYVLLCGINDDVTHARELACLLKGRRAHVNLIPFNDVPGLPYRRPSQEAVLAFAARLKQAGISVKIRNTKGKNIDAACGQLRRKVAAKLYPSARVESSRAEAERWRPASARLARRCRCATRTSA